MRQALFAYGTLRDPRVLRRVGGLWRRPEAARVEGFLRYALSGRPWPALVPGAGTVEGCLYQGLAPPVWRRLDRYEGAGYRRVRVRVRRQDGGSGPAWVYLWRRGRRCVLARRRWQGRDRDGVGHRDPAAAARRAWPMLRRPATGCPFRRLRALGVRGGMHARSA